MGASLLIDGPGYWAMSYQLRKDKTNVLGRSSENDVRLQGNVVSTKHATITWVEGEGWVFKDLGSRNGSKINSQRADIFNLKDGDTIRIGEADLVFKNPEEKKDPGDTLWGDTCVKLAREENRFRDEVSRGHADDLVHIPDILVATPIPVKSQPKNAPGDAPRPPAATPPADGGQEDLEYKPYQHTPNSAKEAADALWVAMNLAEVLGIAAKAQGKDKTEIFSQMLEKISQSIVAENAFLMLANKETKQWVIRAWVGDSMEWTNYEKTHPVPLTVANKAYMEKKAVCNSIAGMPSAGDSESVLNLQVRTYVAIPLIQNGSRAGVLYFDCRRSAHEFEEKHLMFLERVGEYILKIEYQDS